VARRVSNLYFVVLDLALIEPTYQWSLDFYTNLFEMGISKSPPGKDARCGNIIRTFTLFLYESISRSLLGKDKMIYSLTMAIKVLQSDNKINVAQVRFVMLGGASAEDATGAPQVSKSWLNQKLFASLLAFGTLFNRPDFIRHFYADIDQWDSYYYDS
jgi:dynein heavy chain